MKTIQLVCSVPEAGRLLDLGRDGSYEAARRGEIPTIQIGNLKKVPLALMEKKLGLEPGTLTTQGVRPAGGVVIERDGDDS